MPSPLTSVWQVVKPGTDAPVSSVGQGGLLSPLCAFLPDWSTVLGEVGTAGAPFLPCTSVHPLPNRVIAALMIANSLPVVEGPAGYEFIAAPAGSVIKVNRDQIEVHLDLASEQIMGTGVHLLLRQPVSRVLWVVCMHIGPAAGNP